ncbi:glutathione S-transferase family protein [Azospirillum oleiclasticum]|nr:glutathione S-transferase N-terminal domain-containing protein [Azospirillum oleiclasticum]
MRAASHWTDAARGAIRMDATPVPEAPMYTLHTMPSTAGMAPHILLREIGAEHELVFLERAKEEHKSAEYLALNPNGRVPTLVDGDLVVYESAAICLHLCDRHPQAGLAPAVGTQERARFYQWMAWLTNTIQPDMLVYFYPERYVPAAACADLKTVAEGRLHLQFQIADATLADRPYLLGETYSAADAYLFMLARWSRNMTLKARDLPNLGHFLERVYARPAVRAAFVAEGLEAPYF